ncbi:hypothetical protein, partial [Acidithiobacillus sp.]|uniref:hypothetical protein n=1 Tax=Acidithiobacillus sp. TaxID=1872118 RepID=UPI00258C0AE1
AKAASASPTPAPWDTALTCSSLVDCSRIAVPPSPCPPRLYQPLDIEAIGLESNGVRNYRRGAGNGIGVAQPV